jgi:hypothetical protein
METGKVDYFSVPYGCQPGGGLLVANVVLNAPLRPGNLKRIAQMIEWLAVLAEQTVETDDEALLSQMILLGER